MNGPGRVIAAMAIAIAALYVAPSLAQEETAPEEEDYNRDVVIAGDVATGILPLWAFGMAWLGEESREGMREWLWCTGVAEVVVTGLRVGLNNTSWGERPDGNPYGFPSGHAGFAFSQAGFLQERYGWKHGVPAILVASGIAYIRVREGKHYWRDVLVGGALGYGSAMITVSRYEEVTIAPIVSQGFYGLQLARSF
jgi:membrane-associated phospholipid phosphatase